MLRRVLAFLSMACASLGAQEGTLALEVGSARVRQATITGDIPLRINEVRVVPAAIASARARVADRWWMLGTDVNGTLADGVSAGQAIGLATVAPRAWMSSDLAFSLATIGLGESGTSSTQGATLRQQFAWPDHVGVWLRADRSQSARFTRRFEAEGVGGAAWVRAGAVLLWSSLQRVRTNDVALLLGGEALLGRPGVTRRYDDWQSGASVGMGRVDLQVGLRQRRGIRVTPDGDDTRLAGDARVTVRLTQALSTELSYGTQLADPLRGAPEARVAALLMRLQRSGRTRAVTWEAVEGGANVVVRIKGAGPAEVTGSFADWSPRAMSREGNGWIIRLRLPSGTHRLAIRRAGGEWRAPDGLPKSTDDFGGESGLLVIP